MKLALSILSSALYIADSQSCGNTHTSSLLISVSINGRSVEQIGKTSYLDVIESAASEITQTSGQAVGVNYFGGDVGNTQGGTILSMGGSPSDISSALSDLSAYDFDDQYGNSVSYSISQATSTLGSRTGQRYHVIFAAGNPLATGFGTTTNPSNFDDPCPNSITSKKSRVQTYVALIGEQGTNFVKQYYSCIVEDPSSDIIIIDPDSPTSGIAQLEARLCKANGYDVRITEVNPVAGTYKSFIEILNFGATASVQACWGSTGSCSGTGNINTGQYFVAYRNADSGSSPTADAVSSSLPSEPSGENAWTALAVIDSTEYDSVACKSTGTTSDYWQVYLTGRSFELRGVGFNNDYGGNWRASCGPNMNGSPGEDPSDCAETSNSCSDLNQCDANGASGSACTVGSDWCGCTTGYLEDVDTCIVMPEPLTTCDAYVIRDSLTGDDFMYFAVDRVDWDGSVSYSVEYPATSGTETLETGVSTTAVDDFDSSAVGTGSVSITVTTEYDSVLSGQSSSVDTAVTCTISTLEPTTQPTTDPTQQPTTSPTEEPTLAPTFEDPGVYFRSSRFSPALKRKKCFAEARDCCTPFGTQYTDLTGGYAPSGGCNHTFYAIEVQSESADLTAESIQLDLYPDNFNLETTISYTITSYGVVNNSNLYSLSWVGNNLTNGTNDLNLYMYPPGDGTSFDGTVTVSDGETYTFVPLNVTSSTIVCNPDEEVCLTYEQCQERAVIYGLELTSCSTTDSAYSLCEPLYPYIVWVTVTRSAELCAVIFDLNSSEDELPSWFWWVLIALLVFMLIMAWLIYRFWWKQKRTAHELGDAEDELDMQKADNEAGFGKDLDVGDVAFNPIATGVPGMDRPADAFGNEIQQRQMQAHNEMVDVQAEVFQVRQDYGQVNTGPRGGY